jgi:hypothetical protein
VWLYVGEYENTLKGKMTKEQFSAQSPSVQRDWARTLLKCKRLDVYVAMRAGEAHRMEEEAKLVQEEVHAIKKHEGRPVSVEDLVAAFVNGEEAIDITQMKCIGYDRVFAADMRSD